MKCSLLRQDKLLLNYFAEMAVAVTVVPTVVPVVEIPVELSVLGVETGKLNYTACVMNVREVKLLLLSHAF
jgi:hypothetical protein